MNCKPGDLAVIVRGEIPENIGAFVDVIGRWPDVDGRPCWMVRAARKCLTNGGVRTRQGVCFDDCLQPIRPPGEPVEVRKDAEVPA